MSLRKLIPNLDEILGFLLKNEKSIAALVTDGDGTTFEQNRRGNAWDINPAAYVVANLDRIATLGHQVVLSSARETAETAKSIFGTIPRIAIHGNDGTTTWKDGEVFGPVCPDFSAVHAHMQNKFGEITDVRLHDMDHRYGAQFWWGREGSDEIKDAMTEAISLIKDPRNRNFSCAVVPEGVYLIPDGVPGKWLKFLELCAELKQGGLDIGLYIGCGNGGNDKKMLEEIGALPNGIAIWVGPENTKPKGQNVFCVPNEATLSRILGQLAFELPDRRGLRPTELL